MPLTLSVELCLDSLKGCIKLFIVELVLLLSQSEHSVDESLLVFVKLDAVTMELRVEEALVKPSVPLAAPAVLIELLIQVSDLIEELVTVDCQFVDDLLEDRLHLHVGIEPASCLAGHAVLQSLDHISHC